MIFTRSSKVRPWLVDPTWRPLTSEKSISNVREAFEEWYETENGEEISTTTAVEDLDRKRPDLVMLEIRGSVRVVELKKPGYTFKNDDFERFRNYVTAFKDFFEQNSGFREDFPDEAKLTLIADEKYLNEIYQDSWDQLVDSNKVTGRKSWHDLLNDAKKHHQDFIDAEDQVPDVDEDAFNGISTLGSNESED